MASTNLASCAIALWVLAGASLHDSQVSSFRFLHRNILSALYRMNEKIACITRDYIS